MKIERNLLTRMSIADFAAANNLVMLIREPTPGWFMANFKGAEVKKSRGDPILASPSGVGATESEAIESYARQVSMQWLVIDAMTPRRREIKVPVLK